MRSRMTRVAAAAVVIVTCVLAFSMWRETTQDQTRGDSTSKSTVLVSNVYGARKEMMTVDSEGQQTQSLTYLLPLEESIHLVNLSAKQYVHRGLDDATLANMKVEDRDLRRSPCRDCHSRRAGRTRSGSAAVVG